MTTVAAVQMCSSHIIDENLSTAGRLIEQAAKNHARLIVLPENFALMGMSSTDRIVAREPIGKGKIQSFLSAQAKKYGVWIVGGTIPIEGKHKNKVSAACIIFDDQGKVVSRYDKIHLFDVTISQDEIHNESEIVEPGNKLVVIDTPFGKLGIAICYDVRFPEL